MSLGAMNSTLLWATLLAVIFSAFTQSTPTSFIEPIDIYNFKNMTNITNTTSATANYTPMITKRWGGVQYCGISTFVNQISDASPPISDCIRLMKMFEDLDTYMYAGRCRQRTLNTRGSCSLGISMTKPCGDDTRGKIFAFGSGDAVYVVNESIRLFGDTNIGKAGTTGVMRCWRITDKDVVLRELIDVNWGLY